MTEACFRQFERGNNFDRFGITISPRSSGPTITNQRISRFQRSIHWGALSISFA
jgi:hypothetical protein